MKDLNRAERLGKRLLQVYGLKWSERQFKKFKRIDVRLNKSFLLYHVSDWRVLLLGNHLHSSLNELLKILNEPVSLIEYDSLDELDIQLTLLGMNG